MKQLHIVLITDKRGNIINVYKTDNVDTLKYDLLYLYTEHKVDIKELLTTSETVTNSGIRFQHKVFTH